MVQWKISTIKNTDHNEKSVIVAKMPQGPIIVNIIISLATCAHLPHYVQFSSCISKM